MPNMREPPVLLPRAGPREARTAKLDLSDYDSTACCQCFPTLRFVLWTHRVAVLIFPTSCLQHERLYVDQRMRTHSWRATVGSRSTPHAKAIVTAWWDSVTKSC